MTQAGCDGLIDGMIDHVDDHAVVYDVRIGMFWSAVAIESGGRRLCGLASTLNTSDDHLAGGAEPMPSAGRLIGRSALALAGLARSNRVMEASLGLATINAFLPPEGSELMEINAEHVILEHGAGKRVVIVGHFPFVGRLQAAIPELTVLELQPRPGDLPTGAAADVVPNADVVAISGTTLLNHTFGDMMRL